MESKSYKEFDNVGDWLRSETTIPNWMKEEKPSSKIPQGQKNSLREQISENPDNENQG